MPISPVYTTRFMARSGLIGDLSYTVPAGFVAVVTHADVYIDATSLESSSLFLKSVDEGWAFSAWYVTPPSRFYGFWNGRCAFHEGETFGFDQGGPEAFDVQATGYLLTLVA